MRTFRMLFVLILSISAAFFPCQPTAAGAPSLITVGAFTVSNFDDSGQGAAAVRTALVYLDRSATARRLIGSLENAHIFIMIETGYGDHYLPSSNSVLWNPYAGLYTTDAHVQTAALELLHELVHARHAARNPAAMERNHDIPAGVFTNREEYLTIVYGENPVARELGEPQRFNHYGVAFVHTATPTDRDGDLVADSE